MRIVSDNLEEIDDIKVSVALGTFDGLHIGHREIINLAKKYSANIPVMVYAFENIPASYFGSKEKAILSYQEKLMVMSTLDIDFLTMIKFDEKIVNMPPRDFLDYLNYEIDAEVISCGFNYTFGKNAEGDSEFLRTYCKDHGLICSIAPPVLYEGEYVSSTGIRKALSNGDIKAANAMLSYEYFILGTVVEGKRLGNSIGFPTANIKFPDEKLVPKFGVYATRTVIDGKEFPSITNIGVRPTVENTHIANAETFIIGFDSDIYNKEIKVCFINYMRPEKKFSSVEELKNQLLFDREIALQTYFSMLE